ncbi:MAG: hypothetical protein GY715_19745 [Planctomycetes bacterium]|nr:hypothetical protein [Planctomycetota bacterium]
MNRLCLITVLVIGGLFTPTASADDKPVNAMCPISKEPIAATAGTVDHKGQAVGFCCPACIRMFKAWDEPRRDKFVALAKRGEEPGRRTSGRRSRPAESQPASTKSAAKLTFAYPLDICIISGAKLASKGDPIVREYDGREVRFCCGGCIRRFEADPATHFKKIDELIIKDQLRYYPTRQCLVTGEPLFEGGKDTTNNVVYKNRLVRLCCRMCERKFKADPDKYLAMLDKAAADAQRKGYPLDTCLVAGGSLGSMGSPTEMVVAGRLMRFCCAGCEPKVKKDPVKYLAIVDKAWQKRGKFKPER